MRSSAARLGTLTLALAAVAALSLASAPASRAAWPWTRKDLGEVTYPEVGVTAEWLVSHAGARGVAVVDARDEAAYSAGHVPRAISIPPGVVDDPASAGEAFGRLGLSGRERIVCCGDSAWSPEAGMLFWLLEAAGAERALVLEGGMRAYAEAGGELSTEPATREPTEWRTTPRPDRVATLAYVADRYGRKGVEVVDARGRDGWEGLPATVDGEPVERTGHVPHALPYDFRKLFAPDGGLMPPEESRKALSALGPRTGTYVDLSSEFIVYDDGSSRVGALGYFLMRRAGVDTVRYYAGGFAEWSAEGTTPVVRIVHGEELKERLARERRWLRPNAPPGSFIFLDVRHISGYKGTRGHIPGAVNLASSVFADSLDAVLEKHWPKVDRATTPIVTYCYGENCIRSRYTSTLAARAGFLRIERFFGGLTEWRMVGGKTTAG